VVRGERYEIPVDVNGYVPTTAIVSRFLNTSAGAKKGKRNVVADYQNTAKLTLNAKLTPEQIKQWWAAPNSCDVKGVDDVDTKLFDRSSLKSKAAIDAQNKIAFIGTKEQQDKIRTMINTSFTLKEQRAFTKEGGMVIYFDSSLPRNAAASYRGKEENDAFQIRINPRYANIIDETVLHELVHHSRLVDPSREGTLLRSRSIEKDIIAIYDHDQALEEAATVLETLARQSNYFPDNDSYHAYVINPDRMSIEELVKHDRELVAGSSKLGSSGKKGKYATNAVEKGFKDSKIKWLVHPHDQTQTTPKKRLDELSRK